MRIHLGEYGYSLHLTSRENGIPKEIRLPLETTEPAKYLRHLWSYNTLQLPYTPLPDAISRALSEFHSKPSSERPKYFSVKNDRDRVLKWVTKHVETTQGGAISLEEARKIVLKAMVEVGVLSESEEGIIESLLFTDYKEDIEALEPPKESDEEHENPKVEVEPSALAVSVKPPQIAATIVTLALMALGTLILFWHLLIQ